MKIVSIKDIVRKDVPIYYRRLYSGVVVLDLLGKTEEVALDFQVEHMPTGQIEISILSMGKVDYPLIPLQKELKQFIGVMDSSGKLPN